MRKFICVFACSLLIFMLADARPPDENEGDSVWTWHSTPGEAHVDTCCDGTGCTYWLNSGWCCLLPAEKVKPYIVPVPGDIADRDTSLWLEKYIHPPESTSCHYDTTGDNLSGEYRRFVDTVETGHWMINEADIFACIDDSGAYAVNFNVVRDNITQCNCTAQGGTGGLPSALYFKADSNNIFEFIAHSTYPNNGTWSNCRNISNISYRIEIHGCIDNQPPKCYDLSRFPSPGCDTALVPFEIRVDDLPSGPILWRPLPHDMDWVTFNIGLIIKDWDANRICISGIDSPSVQIEINGSLHSPDTIDDWTDPGATYDWQYVRIVEIYSNSWDPPMPTGTTFAVSVDIDDSTKDRSGRHISPTCPWSFSFHRALLGPDDHHESIALTHHMSVLGDTAYPQGEPLPESYDLSRSAIVHTNILDARNAVPAEDGYHKSVMVTSSNCFIDYIRARIIDHPGWYRVGINDNDEFRPWMPGNLIEPDSTFPELPNDSCCSRYCIGPDSLEIFFDDVDELADTLELVLRPIPSFFLGYDTLTSPDRMLLVKGYDPDEQEWDTLALVLPRTWGEVALIDLPSYLQDDNGDVKLRIIWTDFYALHSVGIDTYRTALSITNVAVDSAFLGESATIITSSVTSYDSTFVHLDPLHGLEIRVAYTAPGTDSIQTVFYECVGFVDYYESDADSLWAKVNIATDDITIVDRDDTTSTVSGAFIFIDDGTTQEAGYTNGSGVFNPTANLDYDYDIYVYKQGYRPLKVQHVDDIYDNEVWYNDVQLLGDAFINSGDTLVVLPGTAIRAVPNADASTAANDFSNTRTEIVVHGGHLEIAGNDDNPVTLDAGPGGTGSTRWWGIYARSGGTANIDYAVFRRSESSLLGYSGPGKLRFTNSRVYGTGVYGQFNSNSTDSIFQVEDCYLEHRIVMIATADSSWAKRCSVVAGYESCYNRESGDTIYYEDCNFSGNTSRFVRNYINGKAKYFNVNFDGGSLGATACGFYQYTNAELILDSCHVDISNADYGIRDYVTTATTYARMTTIDDYDLYGAYLQNESDFGKSKSDAGANCFLDDDDYAIYFQNATAADTVWGEYNYYDTLYFGGTGASRIMHNNRTALCIPNPGLERRCPSRNEPIVPVKYALRSAVPNPFNASVGISFEIPEQIEVRLEVFDAMGRQVKILVSEMLDAGYYRAVWDGRSTTGISMPSGVYLYRLNSDKFSDTKKMTLIK